jgi:hypothetical protein
LGLSRQDEDEQNADHRHEVDEEPDDVFDYVHATSSPLLLVDIDLAE